jgi:hypothetical protein
VEVPPALSLGALLPAPVVSVSWPALVSEAPAPLGELRLEPADEPWPEPVPVEPCPVEPCPVEELGEEPWPDESVGELWGKVRPEFGAWKGTGRVRTGLMPAAGTGRVRPTGVGVPGVCVCTAPVP